MRSTWSEQSKEDNPMTKSSELYQKAQQTIPGGVNSPVRAFNGVGGSPLFIERADGPLIFDADGKAYID
ncbi:hypothetical protein ACJBP2_10350, partial [Streptococcus suis]